MRMVTFGMVLMATVVATAWSLTYTTALTFTTPAASSAAMNPHEMMKNAGEMPIHVIVDAI
jgi:hypothetical protein